MSLLQYTSAEMFSATDLVRKNKTIFDKLQSKEIEKAVILKDGKPSMIILDFLEYEKIMQDYLYLKTDSNTNLPKKEEKINPVKADSKISQSEYETALKEIEKLNLDLKAEKLEDDTSSTVLKDFWEK